MRAAACTPGAKEPSIQWHARHTCGAADTIMPGAGRAPIVSVSGVAQLR